MGVPQFPIYGHSHMTAYCDMNIILWLVTPSKNGMNTVTVIYPIAMYKTMGFSKALVSPTWSLPPTESLPQNNEQIQSHVKTKVEY